MAAVVVPSAETAVPVKVLKNPVGSMSSNAIRPTTSTTNGKTMREIAEALDGTLLQKDGWLEHDSSDGVAVVVFPSAETTEPATMLRRDAACSRKGTLACPLTVLEFAKRFLRAVIMADPTFSVSVVFFSGICTQSSWLIPRSL